MPTTLRYCGRAASLLLLALATQPALAASPPPGIAESLAAGQAQDLIVEFDVRTVDSEASAMRRQRGEIRERADILRLRQTRYRDIKQDVRATLPGDGHEVIQDYSSLPLTMLRIRSPSALAALSENRSVVGIYRNRVKYPIPGKLPQLDSQSLNLIGQPVAAAEGLTGSGTTVVVIDTGANYTAADLGSCTAAGIPAATCRISHALYVNSSNKVVTDTNSVTSSANNHGTNVATIVAGVATETRIAMINVFGTSGSTSDSKILAAINWAIANQATYNIRAVNFSLGDGVRHTTQCSSGNAYVSAFANVRAAGIVPIAASGNEAYTDGLANPTCTPGAVSVGAVYTTSYGSVTWSTCTDTTTAADKVACFSNSASYLTTLAPGAIVTAGGLSYGGTSQAAPFVAASMALLSAAYPDESLDQWIAHLGAAGKTVTDSRNGLTSPRLDLASITAAFEEANAGHVPLPPWAPLMLAGFLLATLRR